MMLFSFVNKVFKTGKVISVIILLGILIYQFSIKSFGQKYDNFTVNDHCIGDVCIGDTFSSIKSKYPDYILKPNDTNTGYYIFDSMGNFLIEFSTKKSIAKNNAPIRYIMTSNPNYTFVPGNIRIETKISDLINKYGSPTYSAGPDGYIVTFDDWSIKESVTYKNYKVNINIGVYNPKLEELFKYSGTINEGAEIKMLYAHPESTIINSIEIYSDFYKSGKTLP